MGCPLEKSILSIKMFDVICITPTENIYQKTSLLSEEKQLKNYTY